MDDDSDCTSSSDDDEYESELDWPDVADDPDKIRKGNHPLGLSRNYVPSWNAADSCREIIQNGKDGIIESYGLDPRSFATHWHETKNEIQITVHRPSPSAPNLAAPRRRRQLRPQGELLGFIRFKRKQGSIELVNFNASLKMRNLSLGGTTKRGCDKFVGTHGEGFKLAALVMLRNGRRFQIKSTSASWNFSFRGIYKDRFTCTIRPAADKRIDNGKAALAKETANKPRASLKAYIHQDVVVKIYNNPSDAVNKITEAQFNDWMAVSLDLKGPASDAMMQTDHGDLLLDERFAHRVYLKSLRVEDVGSGGKEYQYGYNFAKGAISRDRERLMNYKEESQMLADIWGAVMQHEEKGIDLARKYIMLFDNPDCADISGAENAVSEATARLIWTRLSTDAANEFFYSDDSEATTECASQVDIITNDIKKQPKRLPKELWKILRRFSLARTPEEQRLHLFESSEPFLPISNSFADGVQRMIRTVLAMDSRLRNVTPVFVNGGSIGINIHYKKEHKTLLIHQKWLDFDKAHEDSACEVSKLAMSERLQQAGAFSCDHVIEDLFELAINDIKGHLQISPLEVVDLRREARERLHQTPRDVELAHVSGGCALEVTWIGNASGVASKYYEDQIFCLVTLHAMSSCEYQKEQVINFQNDQGSEPSCDCEHQIISLSDCSAIFQNLDPEEMYFALVCRDTPSASYGAPSPTMAPRPVTIGAASSNRTPRTYSSFRNPLTRRPDYDTESVDSLGPGESPQSSSLSVPLPAYAVDDSTDGMDKDEPSPSRQSRDSPSRSTADDSNRRIEEDLALDAWKNDEQDRGYHYEIEMPRNMAQALTPRVKCTCDGDSFMNFTYIDDRLSFSFEKNKWIMVRDKSSKVFVAWVHAVHAETPGEDCVNKPHLAITKYSSFQPEAFLWNPGLSGTEDGWEDHAELAQLLLHFSSLDNMGKRADAEVIEIDDIEEVQPASEDFNITFAKVPGRNLLTSKSVRPSGKICRFGRCVKNNTVTIMPIMSHLLPRNESREERVFSTSSGISVFDFTPIVLGLLEGFSQMGYHALAGAGFDESCHMTWRIRTPHCAVFDGSPKTILDDFNSGRLIAPNWPSGVPRSLLYSWGKLKLPIEPGKHQDAFKRISPAVLHSSTLHRFSATLSRLLEHGQTVKIDLSQAKDFGVPQNRLLVTVVASSSQVLASVPIKKIGPPRGGGVDEIARGITDLNFSNPLISQNEHKGFVCSPPAHQRDDGALTPFNVYNHQTGTAAPVTREVIFPVQADGIDVSGSSPWVLVHSERKDRLTVREHARIQGFKDDFIFYGTNDMQYRDVMALQPAQAARAVAECIQTVIRKSSRSIVRSGNDRPEKRRREDISQ